MRNPVVQAPRAIKNRWKCRLPSLGSVLFSFLSLENGLGAQRLNKVLNYEWELSTLLSYFSGIRGPVSLLF
jgi:hypothetical protein